MAELRAQLEKYNVAKEDLYLSMIEQQAEREDEWRGLGPLGIAGRFNVFNKMNDFTHKAWLAPHTTKHREEMVGDWYRGGERGENAINIPEGAEEVDDEDILRAARSKTKQDFQREIHWRKLMQECAGDAYVDGIVGEFERQGYWAKGEPVNAQPHFGYGLALGGHGATGDEAPRGSVGILPGLGANVPSGGYPEEHAEKCAAEEAKKAGGPVSGVVGKVAARPARPSKLPLAAGAVGAGRPSQRKNGM